MVDESAQNASKMSPPVSCKIQQVFLDDPRDARHFFIEVLLAFTSAEYQARAASGGPWAPSIDVLAVRSMEGWHQRRGRCIFGRLDRRPWTKLSGTPSWHLARKLKRGTDL
jgi:hypothetical protein